MFQIYRPMVCPVEDHMKTGVLLLKSYKTLRSFIPEAQGYFISPWEERQLIEQDRGAIFFIQDPGYSPAIYTVIPVYAEITHQIAREDIPG